MRSVGTLAVLACLAAPVAASAAAVAEEAAPESDSRYAYHRVDDGFVRLDMRTGQVSLCAHRAAGWSCQAMPDDRITLEGEIARLAGENAALKKELIDRGLPLPPLAKAGPAAGPPAARDGEPRMRLPNQGDLDRMLSVIERVWRRFMEMIVNVQQDLQKKT